MVDAAITARAIVDGDHPATCHLLWSLIAHYSLSVLLDREALATEAERAISSTEKWRRAGLLGMRGTEPTILDPPDIVALRNSWGVQTSDGDLISALLAWCQAVCHSFGVPVTNFSSSFADGRALCVLVHYYLPWVSERCMFYIGLVGDICFDCGLRQLTFLVPNALFLNVCFRCFL